MCVSGVLRWTGAMSSFSDRAVVPSPRTINVHILAEKKPHNCYLFLFFLGSIQRCCATDMRGQFPLASARVTESGGRHRSSPVRVQCRGHAGGSPGVYSFIYSNKYFTVFPC